MHTEMYWNSDELEFIISCKPQHKYDIYKPSESLVGDKWVLFISKSPDAPVISLKFTMRMVLRGLHEIPMWFIIDSCVRKNIRSESYTIKRDKVITHSGMWEDYILST